MKKQYIGVTLGAIALAAVIGVGAANAATVRDITSKLGGVAGDLFKLAGSLHIQGNEFLTGSLSNPSGDVKVADNLRVDGKVYRGAKAGTTDTMPFIVNDQMQVEGKLTAKGNLQVNGLMWGKIKYDNATSGLTSTTVQGAIDELGANLSKVVGGSGFSSAGVNVKNALAATNWAGYVTYSRSGVVKTTSNLSMTLTPASDTSGTWTVNAPSSINPFCNECSTVTTGNYAIAENVMFISYVNGGNTMESIATVTTTGTKIVIYNDGDKAVIVLNRQ